MFYSGDLISVDIGTDNFYLAFSYKRSMIFGVALTYLIKSDFLKLISLNGYMNYLLKN